MKFKQSKFRLVPMRPRDPREPGRTASPLELFFDLVFVVAVSIASAKLHHGLSEGHIVEAVCTYAIVFNGIWWAWMNFTWFATSFDTDDWLYRATTFVQMAGVLVYASGIGPAFDDHNLSVMVYAYVVMRVALCFQWLRASRAEGVTRKAAHSYVVGVACVQVLWLLALLLPDELTLPSFFVLAACEWLVPVVAEHRGRTPWHPHHITERYGLFTLIVLGESLLASTNAIIESLNGGGDHTDFFAVAVLAFVATAAMWWIYFWPPHHTAITSFASSIAYGYGHYFIFAAAAAFSAGIEIEIDLLSHHSELHRPYASFAYAAPLAIFIFGIWLLALRRHGDGWVNGVVPLGALLMLLAPLTPLPLVFVVAVLIALVAVLVWRPPLEIRVERSAEAPLNR